MEVVGVRTEHRVKRKLTFYGDPWRGNNWRKTAIFISYNHLCELSWVKRCLVLQCPYSQHYGTLLIQKKTRENPKIPAIPLTTWREASWHRSCCNGYGSIARPAICLWVTASYKFTKPDNILSPVLTHTHTVAFTTHRLSVTASYVTDRPPTDKSLDLCLFGFIWYMPIAS